MRWWKGTVLAAVLVVVLFTVAVWMLAPQPVRFVSTKGQVTTLQEVHFTTNTVSYRHPKASFFEKYLPKPLRKRFERAMTQQIYAKPPFPGEPMLSCAVTVQIPEGEHGWIGRMIVADELGNEFDPVVQGAGNMGNELSVLETSAFPRRGRTLKLRMMSNSETVAEFEIPNPAHGKHPHWKANELPVSAKTGDLEVKLVEFASERPKDYSGETFPNTSCIFELVQRGVATTNWIPMRAEFSDATGNHWRPPWDRERVRYEQGRLKVAFMGALWAGENAWKVQMDFQQQAGFAEEELVRWEGLEVPIGAGVVRPTIVHEAADGRVELLGLFGPSAYREAAQKIFLNINPRLGSVTIALKLGLREHNRAFSLLGILDEKGQPMEPIEKSPGPMSVREESYVPFLVHFKPRAGVKKVSMVYALPKTRRVEFLAKPVQR